MTSDSAHRADRTLRKPQGVQLAISQGSDAGLVGAVAGIVSEPRCERADSFVLHAPLELCARFGLLPHVAPEARGAARERIAEIAVRYEAFGPGVGELPAGALPEDPGAALIQAIGEGDADRAEAAAFALGWRCSPRELVGVLGEAVVERTAAAAHAPIFLYLLPRVAPRGELPGRLLRPLARGLAAAPEARVSWFDDVDLDGEADALGLERALAGTPALELEGDGFIHPTLMQVEGAGLAAERLGGVVGRPTVEAGRAILRTAARSMLLESTEHSKYGWTHALTLPQALLGIARSMQRPGRALAMAATHVLTFRATRGSGALDPVAVAGLEDSVGEFAVGEYSVERATRLASAAAVHEDAHVAKYALACLDASAGDRAARGLYLAAGERLLEAWGVV